MRIRGGTEVAPSPKTDLVQTQPPFDVPPTFLSTNTIYSVSEFLTRDHESLHYIACGPIAIALYLTVTIFPSY